MLAAQVRDRSVELVPVEAHQVHASALRDEQPRGCESDAALPAGDERHLAGRRAIRPSFDRDVDHARPRGGRSTQPFRAPESQSTRGREHTGNTSLQRLIAIAGRFAAASPPSRPSQAVPGTRVGSMISVPNSAAISLRVSGIWPAGGGWACSVAAVIDEGG